MVDEIRQTLGQVLKTVEQEPNIYRGWLFLPKQPWTLNTEGLFFDLDKNSGAKIDLTPDDIKSKKLRLTLDSDLIGDVISNARAQRPDLTIEELVTAFAYYCNQDAFMNFQQDGRRP